MSTFTRNALLICAAAAVGACASAPKQSAELDAARAEYEQVSSDPLAREAAASRLDRSQQQLRMAEQSLQAKAPPEVVRQQAYLAKRNAEIAGEQVAERKARRAVEDGETARQRVLLEARTTEAERAKSAADIARAQAEAAGAAAAAAGAAAASSAAEAEKLRSDLAALQAKQTERGLVLTLGDVLFDTAQATLKPGAAGTLDRVSAFLAKEQGYQVLIEGHTDSRGSDEYNLSLSERRAEAVRTALVTRGVGAERVVARGLGESYPVASNDDSAGQQQNRRVELIFSDGQKPTERVPLAGR